MEEQYYFHPISDTTKAYFLDDIYLCPAIPGKWPEVITKLLWCFGYSLNMLNPANDYAKESGRPFQI